MACFKGMPRHSENRTATALLLIPVLLLGSGCLMMRGRDMMGNVSDHQTQRSEKTVETERAVQKGEATAAGPSRHVEHKKESKSKRTSKTLLIVGGIGMGLMMIIMMVL